MFKKTNFTRVIGFAIVAAPALAMADDPTTALTTAATTAITAVVTAGGTILVAMFAWPVAKKTYRIIRGAFQGA